MPLPRALSSRKFWIILLGLLGAYALAGFFLVPAIVARGLHEYLEVQQRRHVDVGAVRFNPFTLRAEVDRLEIADADGKPMLGFARLSADVRPRSLLRDGVEFGTITLVQPHLRLIERRGGSLNLMDLVPPSDPNSPMPKVWIDSLRVEHGDAVFADLNRLAPFEIAVTAFTLELDDFYSRSAANAFRISALSKLDATVSFSGTFGLDPFASQGELHLGNFRAQAIADAGPNLLPFDMPHGTLDVNGHYDYSLHGQNPGLTLDFSDLTLHDGGLRAPGEAIAWVEIPYLQALDTRVDFLAAETCVGKLRIEGARVNAWRERNGTLNLQRLYVPLPDEPGAPAAPAKPWHIALPSIEVAGADVSFADRGPRHPSLLHLAPLDITIGGYVLPEATAVDLDAKATVNGSGHIALVGKVGLAPIAGHLTLDLATLPLPSLQPYIEGRAALQLRSGSLSFKGTTDIHADGAISVDGDGSIDALRTTDDALGDDFVKWSSLRFSGLHAGTRPTALKIREITAHEPYARVIVGSNGRTNLSAVLRGASTAAAAPDSPPAMPIEIDVVRIDGGSMNFADFSVKPQFATGIHNLGGTIKGLSSAADSRATIALEGKVDRYAPARIDGEINMLTATRFANVRMNFKNLELTGLSPYSGKFAGYWIDKGKMSAELDYRIENRKLNANHHIVVDQLTLGQRVDSADATSLPVRLGIALLKDKDGIIDIELPVTGSLDDPDFRLGKVVWKVVVNLFSKAVTSPFRLLGSLFGGGEELEFLEFRAGEATLGDATRGKVATLVKALDARPGLNIDVPMGYAAPFDGPALAHAQLEAELATRATQKLKADSTDGTALARLRATPAAYRAVLEDAYTASFGHPAAVPAPPTGTAPDAAATEAIRWLERELHARMTVGARELEALGTERAAAVQSALLEGTGIDPARVFLVKAPPQQVVGEHVQLKLTLH